MRKQAKKRKGLYRTNKEAKVGTEIECPVCHTKFIKRQYSQAFCCTQCKDKFHNNHDGDRHRAGYYGSQYESFRDCEECFNVSEDLDIYS